MQPCPYLVWVVKSHHQFGLGFQPGAHPKKNCLPPPLLQVRICVLHVKMEILGASSVVGSWWSVKWWCDPRISRCWGYFDFGPSDLWKKHVLFWQSKWFCISEGELLLIMIRLIDVVCRGWVGNLTFICWFVDLFTLVLQMFVYVFVWVRLYSICLLIFWSYLKLVYIRRERERERCVYTSIQAGKCGWQIDPAS